jgi:hypothetical protein
VPLPAGAIPPYGGQYPNIAPWVFSRLRDAHEDGLLADHEEYPGSPRPYTGLDREISSVVARLVARFPCVVSYAALSGSDLAAFEEAAGLLTAARLLTTVTTGGTNGDLILEKTDTTTRQFSQNNTPGNPGERRRWETEAEYALMRVSCVAAAYGRFSGRGVVMPTRGTVTSADEYA